MRLSKPNRETLLAILEAEKISEDPEIERYGVEEVLAELKK